MNLLHLSAAAAPTGADPNPKVTYRITRKDGAVRCWVFRGHGVRAPLYHLTRKATSGFDVGTPSKATHDLAAALLADHFGSEPPHWLARAFAASFLAHSAWKDGRDVTVEDLEHWIESSGLTGLTERAS